MGFRATKSNPAGINEDLNHRLDNLIWCGVEPLVRALALKTRFGRSTRVKAGVRRTDRCSTGSLQIEREWPYTNSHSFCAKIYREPSYAEKLALLLILTINASGFRD